MSDEAKIELFAKSKYKNNPISRTYQRITIITHEYEYINRRCVISNTYASDRSILWIMVSDD